jgi:hypothetical protein
VLRELAHWGARVMGPPTPDVELAEGWLQDALHIAMPATSTSIEFRIDGEIASLVDGVVVAGPAERPDVVVSGDARGFYDLVVERDVDAVEVRGSRTALRTFLDTLPPVVTGPAEAAEAAAPVPA